MKSSQYTQRKLKKALTLVQGGVSVAAAADKHGIPRSTLGVKVKNAGIVSTAQKRRVDLSTAPEAARLLRSQGWSYPKISKEVGCCVTSIMKWCKGISLTYEQNRCNLVGKYDLQEKAIICRRDGMYFNEIAELLGVSKSSVCLWVNTAKKTEPNLDFKVDQRRDEKKLHRISSGSTKVQKSYTVDGQVCHERCQEIIDLRKKGLSYGDIEKIVALNKSTVGQICRQYSFSDEEKKEIDISVHQNVMARRHRGELKPVGGFRQGAERSKSGYYKGIYCSSTYELCWVIYNLDHGNQFERFPGFLEDEIHKFKYYPDFLIGKNHIIEVKGYENKKEVSKKTRLAERLGYKVTLVRKGDLLHMFEYVDQKYGVKYNNRHTLYDDHKPFILLRCAFCGCEFERFKVRKNSAVLSFCSPSCGGKHRSKINKLNATKKF